MTTGNGPGKQGGALVSYQDPSTAVASTVKEGITKALTTDSPNAFAMTFREKVEEHGVVVAERVAPYVKKAGRSVLLAEVAKKKGGLVGLFPVCVRSSFETQKVLMALFDALDDAHRKQFLETRGNDYRALTAPDKHAIYKFSILFRNGERWEGEGLATPFNIKGKQGNRMDELAETRAFMRAVGRGLADGFMDPNMVGLSDDEIDDAAGLVLEQEELVETQVIEEAERDGNFRPPGRPGQGQDGLGDQSASRNDQRPAASAPVETGPGGTPVNGGVGGSPAEVRPNGADREGRPVPTITQLIDLAKVAGVLLTSECQRRFGVGLSKITAAQRLELETFLTGGEEEVAAGE